MITKAIVEEIISPYQVKIRIPTLDKAEHSPLSTSAADLNTATICSLPNCYINVQVGDVVFVGFEDNTYYRAVILGHLCREAMSESYADVTFGNIAVRASAELPNDTRIGELSYEQLQALSGIKENIQKQIDSIKEDIAIIYEKLDGGNA